MADGSTQAATLESGTIADPNDLQDGYKRISDDVKKAIVDLEEYCQASLNKQFTVTNLTQIQQFVNSVRNGFIDILLDKQSCEEKLAESQSREVESLKKQRQIIIDNLKSKASNVPGKSQSVTSYAEKVKMPAKPIIRAESMSTQKQIVEENAENHVLILNPMNASPKLAGKSLTEARDKLVKNLPVKDLKIAVKSSGPISNGGLLISFPSKKDMDVAKDNLNKELVKQATGWVPKIPGKLLPKLTIANVNKNYNVIIKKKSDLQEDEIDEFRETIAA